MWEIVAGGQNINYRREGLEGGLTASHFLKKIHLRNEQLYHIKSYCQKSAIINWPHYILALSE